MPAFKNIYYIHFDSIDSTNTWTKNHAHTLDPQKITCITALEQTAGRGRGAHKWISPKGENIYATIYFTTPLHAPYIANLAQIASLSCARMLKLNGLHPQIKWPNDILIDGKKIAGTLAETVSFEDKIGIVLGIGINVNMSERYLDTIDQPATSLCSLTHRLWDKEEVLKSFLKELLVNLEYLKTDGFGVFVSEYEALLAYKGEKITCSDQGKTIEGICRSIDSLGRLHIELPSGEILKLYSGEVNREFY